MKKSDKYPYRPYSNNQALYRKMAKLTAKPRYMSRRMMQEAIAALEQYGKRTETRG